LHRALLSSGVDSLMYVARKYGDDPTVLGKTGQAHVIYNAVRDRLDRVPLRFYDWDSTKWWTVGWLPFDISREVAAQAPDIVHFHWTGRGITPIGAMRRLKNYRLVWSLRDMWPLTGGCHYAGDCERFLTGCGQCPQLGSRTRFDLSSWQWNRKERAWRDLSIGFVAASTWMARLAERSPLTAGNPVRVIPNGINMNFFKPIDKMAARDAWDLPRDKRIILFGAINSTSDPRKGFSYLVDALNLMRERDPRNDTMVVVFGANDGASADLGHLTRYMGTLKDDLALALLYSAADVMVVPSLQENAGKTAMEAMACGVPVVAFANSGQTDIVDHKQNGYLAENRSAASLADGMEWCLDVSRGDDRLSTHARQKALRRFDAQGNARQYMALYEEMLSERRRVVPLKPGRRRPARTIAADDPPQPYGQEALR
jgi:glycosyltransferase involved in cell wall biosynthesis